MLKRLGSRAEKLKNKIDLDEAVKGAKSARKKLSAAVSERREGLKNTVIENKNKASDASTAFIQKLELREKIDSSNLAARAMWEQQKPVIENAVVEGFLSITEDKLTDEATFSVAAENFYELLPLGVRLVISRDLFYKYLLASRESILLKVRKAKANRLSMKMSAQEPCEAGITCSGGGQE